MVRYTEHVRFARRVTELQRGLADKAHEGVPVCVQGSSICLVLCDRIGEDASLC